MPGLNAQFHEQQQQQQVEQPQGQQEQPKQEGSNPFAFLGNNPMFQQLRGAIQQNPQLLQSLLGQLAVSNPQLFQVLFIKFFSFNFN